MPVKFFRRLPLANLVLANLVLAGAVLAAGARAETAVDLQLVLAVDTSGSVDEREYALQLAGIAAALRDETVLAAIQSGPNKRIAASVALWSDPSLPKSATPWHILSDAESVAGFARRVQGLARIRSGGTGIGSAIRFCVDLFQGNGLASPRRVIDLSGDGAETAWREWGISPAQARTYALSRGVTINGLAILTDEPALDAYYRREVVGGPGAFVMAVDSLKDFAAAMRRKLIREITYRPQLSRLAD